MNTWTRGGRPPRRWSPISGRSSPTGSGPSSPMGLTSKETARPRSAASPSSTRSSWAISTRARDSRPAGSGSTWRRRSSCPTQEFRRSLDAFPLEYDEILRAHERVFGGDPFDGVDNLTRRSAPRLRNADQEPPPASARRLHRGRRAPAGDRRSRHRLGAGIRRAAPQRRAAEQRAHTARREAATREGARAAGLPEGIVVDILRLEHRPAIPMTDGAKLFPDYLAAVEQLARAVDAWRF